MLKDQPLAPGYYSDDIEIDIAVVSGPLNTAGVVEHVKYTLTELALQNLIAVSYTHLRAHETRHDLVCRLLLEKKKYTSPSPRDKRQSRMPSSA